MPVLTDFKFGDQLCKDKGSKPVQVAWFHGQDGAFGADRFVTLASLVWQMFCRVGEKAF